MVEIQEDVAISSILQLLSSRYGLQSESLARLPTGQGTINYRAAASDFAAFVKHYPPGSDLLSEREAIQLSEMARQKGIPAAPIIRNLDGDVIDETGSTPISVWSYHVQGHSRGIVTRSRRGSLSQRRQRTGRVCNHAGRVRPGRYNSSFAL